MEKTYRIRIYIQCQVFFLKKNIFFYNKYQLFIANEKCNLIKELLNIISYIHEQKIIHRDLQLKNILYNANTKQLKLIDFGIAKKEIENNLNIS